MINFLKINVNSTKYLVLVTGFLSLLQSTQEGTDLYHNVNMMVFGVWTFVQVSYVKEITIPLRNYYFFS